ncbi:MAG: hypothetical protein ACOYL6_03190 [Bacteriovoracaceae bacterium]
MLKSGLLCSILFMGSANAQIDWVSATGKQHLNVQISNEAVKTIVLSALNTAKEKSGKMIVSVPAQGKTIKEQIKNEKFQPVIDIIQELTALDLGQPFNFTIASTMGAAKAFVDSKNVKLNMLEANKNSFILSLSTSLTGIELAVPKLSICEGKACTKKNLRVDIGGITIKQIPGTSLNVAAKIKISIKEGIATAQVYDLITNLGKKSEPHIDVNFASLKIPPVSISINDQETTMDTSKIRELVLEYKTDIANQIILQAANIMKNDVEGIINGFLKGKNFSTKVGGTYQRKYEPFDLTYKPTPIDNTYAHHHYPISKNPTPVVPAPSPSTQQQLVSELEAMVNSADFGFQVSKIAALNNRLDLSFNPFFAINGSDIVIPFDIGYGPYLRELSPLIYSSAPKDYSVAIGISEAFINAIVSTPEESLDMINAVLSLNPSFKGITIDYPGVKLHILNGRVYAVVNLHVNLDKVTTESAWEGFQKWLAGISEVFHETHGHMRFPLEIALTPAIISQNGEKFLQLKPTSPITGTSLNNTFGYYSNLGKATGAVKDKIINTIRAVLSKPLSKDIMIPLKSLTSQAELKVDPKSIGVEPSGHLVIYGDIQSLDLKKIMEKK